MALAATAFLSSYIVRVPVMWRQAPITAAIVIASGLERHTKEVSIEIGLRRVAEVFFGCVLGLAVTWVISKSGRCRNRAPPRSRFGHDGPVLLSQDDVAPLEVAGPDGPSPFFIICDHAGRLIPRALGTLGLPAAELNGTSPGTSGRRVWRAGWGRRSARTPCGSATPGW